MEDCVLTDGLAGGRFRTCSRRGEHVSQVPGAGPSQESSPQRRIDFSALPYCIGPT